MLGQTLKDRYAIKTRLGKGAMGTVYRAVDTQTGREVALKVISSDLAVDPEMLERFKREGEALRKLRHPNIVEFLDAFQHEENYVIVMEFISGGSLHELIENGPVPIDRARRIALELCDALIRSHHLNIIHRDLKPENVLIAEDGTPKLADFGVARLNEGTRMTRSGTQVGTPYYMAPEAWEGRPLDAQADIWSLGVVLFEMLAGQVPFGGDTGAAVMNKVLTTPPPDLRKLRSDVPAGMAKIITRMLTRDTSRRYQSMRQLAADLESGSLNKTPVPAKRETGLALGRAGLITVIAILIVGAVYSVTRYFKPEPAITNTTVPEETPASTAAPAVSGIVTLWHSYGTGSSEEIALSRIIDQANADLPGVTINVLQVPFNDIFTKYRTEVAVGGGPDIFLAPNDSLGDDARAGLIVDITDLASARLDEYSRLSIDGMSVDGRLYGIPESLKAIALWYNRDLIKTPPATTDELAALMEGGTPVALSFGCYHHYGFFGSFGGSIFDENWNVIADQGGVVNAMEYLNGLYQISAANGWPRTDSDGLAPFTEGRMAIITNGNWAMVDYRNALGDRLGVSPLPSGPGGPATPLLGVDGFYINPNSTNQDAALEVALYLTNAASQTVMMNEAGHVPVRTDIEITDPLLQGLVDAFNTGSAIRPQVPELGRYWSNFCGTDQVFEGGMSAKQWVAEATSNANK